MNCNKGLRILVTTILLAVTLAVSAQKENLETFADFHHVAAYIVATLLIGLFVMIFTNRLYYYRDKDTRAKGQQLNKQLGLVLYSNKTQIFTYNVQKRLFSILSESGEEWKDMAAIDFSQFFDHDDFKRLHNEFIQPISEGRKENGCMIVRGAKISDKEKIYDIKISILHGSSKGIPKVLLGIQRDITEEYTRRENAQKLSIRYRTVFSSSLADMIYYDENGILTDINDKACETFGITNRTDLMKRKVHITDIPSYRDVDIEKLEKTQFSSITDIDKVKASDERIPELTQGGKIYYEVALTPIRDSEGKLHGVIAAGRNITEMVLSYHRQQMNRKILEHTTESLTQYIKNINYTLRISGVRMLNYNPDTHTLEVASDINKIEYRLSQIRCASLLTVRERRKLRGLFLRMDRKTPGALFTNVETIFHDVLGRNIYLTINMVPVKDDDGNITNYFGMARNDTEMHFTETKLEEETKKAQETEELKNTFLTNMSYEIRTPLNAVIGFAELFNSPHDEADEPVFAEEIKRNTGNLLKLVNDILFISRLDAKMVEFNYNETDFAAQFEGYCYMGLGNINPNLSMTIENPYSQLLVRIDEQNLGSVISKICERSAKTTKEGSIRAKYDYRHGELSISIEDTSPGLDKETISHIFDRFANDTNNGRKGTGLELPIIKSIVEQMGGSIEIQSEQGKGTAVYLIIPCEMIKMEKK